MEDVTLADLFAEADRIMQNPIYEESDSESEDVTLADLFAEADRIMSKAIYQD